MDPNKIPDHSSPLGAARLAERIRDYWAHRGCAVHVRVEVVAGMRMETIVAVRSDMIGGLPREFRKQSIAA